MLSTCMHLDHSICKITKCSDICFFPNKIRLKTKLNDAYLSNEKIRNFYKTVVDVSDEIKSLWQALYKKHNTFQSGFYFLKMKKHI